MSAADALLLHFQTGTQSSVLLDDIQRITFVNNNLQIKTAESVETVALGDIAKISFGVMIVTDVPAVEEENFQLLPANIVGYYSIMGQKLLQEPQSGIYIIQYDNGKTEKVVR